MQTQWYRACARRGFLSASVGVIEPEVSLLGHRAQLQVTFKRMRDWARGYAPRFTLLPTKDESEHRKRTPLSGRILRSEHSSQDGGLLALPRRADRLPPRNWSGRCRASALAPLRAEQPARSAWQPGFETLAYRRSRRNSARSSNRHWRIELGYFTFVARNGCQALTALGLKPTWAADC